MLQTNHRSRSSLLPPRQPSPLSSHFHLICCHEVLCTDGTKVRIIIVSIVASTCNVNKCEMSEASSLSSRFPWENISSKGASLIVPWAASVFVHPQMPREWLSWMDGWCYGKDSRELCPKPALALPITVTSHLAIVPVYRRCAAPSTPRKDCASTEDTLSWCLMETICIAFRFFFCLLFLCLNVWFWCTTQRNALLDDLGGSKMSVRPWFLRLYSQ